MISNNKNVNYAGCVARKLKRKTRKKNLLLVACNTLSKTKIN